MPYNLLMPQLGMTMTEGSVVKWLKEPGDAVEKGELLYLVQTDKVEIEIESPCSGTLAQVLVDLGQLVPVGTVIGRVTQPGDSLEPMPRVAMNAPTAAQDSPIPSSPTSNTDVSASPNSDRPRLPSQRAKKLARELGVDVHLVPDYDGSGRIVEADVERFYEERSSVGPKSALAPAVMSSGVDKNETSSAAHKIIAAKMTASLQVVITDCPWEDNSVEREILEENGIRVARAQCTTPLEVIEACKDADALLVGWAPITDEVVRSLKRCRLLMRYGTGFDNIDLDAATRAGIAVGVNAEYCLEEVATHALALLLACHRQLSVLQDGVRNGRWDPLNIFVPFPPLSQQTVGILGFGRIGQRLAGMVRPLAKRVFVHDPLFSGREEANPNAQFVSFAQLLAESDYISIHVPLNKETHHLFGAETIARMKKGAYIINCARGEIVDEAALVVSLRQHHLAGAALDVFSKEPLPADSSLRGFPQVIITPHAAWYSTQADHRLHANPAQNIVRFFRGEAIPLLNSITALGTK